MHFIEMTDSHLIFFKVLNAERMPSTVLVTGIQREHWIPRPLKDCDLLWRNRTHVN